MLIQHDEDGHISHVMTTYAPGAADTWRAHGISFIEIPHPPTFDVLSSGYVCKGKLKLRPTPRTTIDKVQIAADGVDKARITWLPSNCIVNIDGEPHQHTSGPVEITSNMPATYIITVEHWPFLPWSAEVIAS